MHSTMASTHGKGKNAAWKSSTYTAPRHEARKFSVKLNHTSTDSKLATPYAARKVAGSSVSGGVTNKPISNNRTPIVQPYSSFADPHLNSYFNKKFSVTHTPSRSDASPYLTNLASTHKKRPTTASASLRTPTASSMVTPSSSALLGKTTAKRPMVTYRVQVKTGDKKAASTTARVFISIHGAYGKLNKRRLWRPNLVDESDGRGPVMTSDERFLFPRGETRTFELQGPDIGEPTSLSIEHDGLSEKHAWYLEDVVITNTSTGLRWRFACDRWLSLFHSDCHISLELRPTNNTAGALTVSQSTRQSQMTLGGRRSKKVKPAPQFTVYEITVATGDVRGGGTDANVFIALTGEKGSTPKTQMLNGKSKNFARGATSVFRMRATCLNEITSIVLEHDNSGFGPGWFLEKVTVLDPGVEGQESDDATVYHFNCAQWLARDAGDCQISRELYPSTAKDIMAMSPIEKSDTCKYVVTTVTGDCRGAGTDANVMVTLFGELGDSGPQTLENSKANFERKRVDKFEVSCSPLGVIDRLFVGHDNSGFGPGWFLEEVTVEDTSNRNLYKFPCCRWLAKDEDDGEVSRVLEAESCQVIVPEEDQALLQGQRAQDGASQFGYKVTVWTGDKRFAGTDANVTLIIHTSTDSTAAHDSTATDDSTAAHAGSSGGDDSGAEEFSKNVFHLSKDLLIPAEHSSHSTSGLFSRGAANTFLLNSTEHFDPISTITLSHDNKGLNAGWFLEKVSVEDLSSCSSGSSREYLFICNKWLDDGEGDKATARTLRPSNTLNQTLASTMGGGRGQVVWSVWAWTSDIRNAGTDARVFLQLYGSDGVTDVAELDNEADNFERGELDKFKVSLSDVGQPYKLRIHHDNSNPYPGWHVDKIRLENSVTGEKYTFQCQQWLARDEGDGEIVRELAAESLNIVPLPSIDYTVVIHCSKCRGAAGAGRTADTSSSSGVCVQIVGQRGDTGVRQLFNPKQKKQLIPPGQASRFSLKAISLGDIEKMYIFQRAGGSDILIEKIIVSTRRGGKDYIFMCNEWLKANGGELQLQRHATEMKQKPSRDHAGDTWDSSNSKPGCYQLTVNTSDVRGAGTDANISVVLFGQSATSQLIKLKKSLTHRNKFERNQEDVFEVDTGITLGRLLKLRLSHDNSGIASDWHLRSVEVRAVLESGCSQAVVFPCDKWLGKRTGVFVDLAPLPGPGAYMDDGESEAASETNEKYGCAGDDEEEDDDEDDDAEDDYSSDAEGGDGDHDSQDGDEDEGRQDKEAEEEDEEADEGAGGSAQYSDHFEEDDDDASDDDIDF